MGYDKPRHLGRGATGGHLAAPIAKEFYKMALADKPGVPFAPPPGIKLIRVDPKTGMRAAPGQGGTILEAFKPGTGPSESAPLVGYGGPDDPQQQTAQPYRVSPDADRAVRSGGTGGLY
jgi:penicillin-binding protein 1A